MNKHTFSFIFIIFGLIGILLAFETKYFAQPIPYEFSIVFFSAFAGAGITRFIIQKRQETPRFYRKFIKKLEEDPNFYFLFKSEIVEVFKTEFNNYRNKKCKRLAKKSPSKVYLDANDINTICHNAAHDFLYNIMEEPLEFKN